MTIELQNSVVYGPVASRRLGASLGINILPTQTKFCLSDCIYCQYGRTDRSQMKGIKLPPAEKLLAEMEREFTRIRKQGDLVDSITFSGNGEPTLHPEFGLLVREVKALRDRFFPGKPLSILSDASQVYRTEIRKALEELDVRYMKLDAGDAEMYRQINPGFANPDIKRVIENLKKLPEIIIQSLFITAPVNNLAQPHLTHWLDAIAEIRPKGIHLYTVARSTADPSICGATSSELESVAGCVLEKTGIQATVIS